MAQFVGQGAEAVQIVVVAHHDEGVGAGHAGGEGAHPLAFVGINVHPALAGRPLLEDGDIFLAQRPHPFGNPVDGRLIFNFWRVGNERRFDVVLMQLVVAQCLPPHAPVAVPGGQIAPEGLDKVVEDFHGNEAGVEGGFQGGFVASRPHYENVLLDPGGQGVGHGILECQVGVGIVFPGSAPNFPVNVRDEGADGSLGDVVIVAILTDGVGEVEVGVG